MVPNTKARAAVTPVPKDRDPPNSPAARIEALLGHRQGRLGRHVHLLVHGRLYDCVHR